MSTVQIHSFNGSNLNGALKAIRAVTGENAMPVINVLRDGRGPAEIEILYPISVQNALMRLVEGEVVATEGKLMTEEDRDIKLVAYDGSKIEAIKGVRAVAQLTLLDAKNLLDDMEDGQATWITIRRSDDRKTAIRLLEEHGLKIESNDEPQDDKLPLSLDMLALKLAMLSLTPAVVDSLADALTGIEDAEGSLREVATRMRKVA